ncbi:MAG: SCO family protein [Candidatus Methylomirabilales bacterium]
MTTHENKSVQFYDDMVKGKIVLINFMFTNCSDGICPPMTGNLVRVQRLLGDRVGRDIFMLSITMDPGNDTPEVLKKYAESYGVGPGWTFLTGKYEDIEKLRRNLGIYDPDPIVDADKTQHAGLVTFGNERTWRWAALPALMKAEQIVETVLRITDPNRGRRRSRKNPQTSQASSR